MYLTAFWKKERRKWEYFNCNSSFVASEGSGPWLVPFSVPFLSILKQLVFRFVVANELLIRIIVCVSQEHTVGVIQYIVNKYQIPVVFPKIYQSHHQIRIVKVYSLAPELGSRGTVIKWSNEASEGSLCCTYIHVQLHQNLTKPKEPHWYMRDAFADCYWHILTTSSGFIYGSSAQVNVMNTKANKMKHYSFSSSKTLDVNTANKDRCRRSEKKLEPDVIRNRQMDERTSL